MAIPIRPTNKLKGMTKYDRFCLWRDNDGSGRCINDLRQWDFYDRLIADPAGTEFIIDSK